MNKCIGTRAEGPKCTALPALTTIRLTSKTIRMSQYQKNIDSVTLCLYATCLFNFLHFSRFHSVCLAWQRFSTTSLQIFFSLPLGLNPIHFTLYAFSPNHCNRFLKHTHTIAIYVAVIISPISNLSLNSLHVNLSATQHIQLIIHISALWSASSFSFLTGQV